MMQRMLESMASGEQERPRDRSATARRLLGELGPYQPAEAVAAGRSRRTASSGGGHDASRTAGALNSIASRVSSI